MAGMLLPPFALLGGEAALAQPPYAFANAEAETLVAAMTMPPNGARRALIDTFVGALKTAGVWSKIDVMWVLAAHDEQAGRLNWKSPGSFTLTAVNAVTFTVDRGFAGNGSSSYLDTGWARLINGTGFTQDAAHISVYQRTSPNGNEAVSENTGGFRLAVNAGAGNLSRAKLNSSVELQAPAGGALPTHVIARRNDSTNASLVRDGVEVLAPTAAASSSFGGGTVRIGVRGTGTFVSSQVAMLTLGAYLTDPDCLSLYDASNDYLVVLVDGI